MKYYIFISISKCLSGELQNIQYYGTQGIDCRLHEMQTEGKIIAVWNSYTWPNVCHDVIILVVDQSISAALQQNNFGSIIILPSVSFYFCPLVWNLPANNNYWSFLFVLSVKCFLFQDALAYKVSSYFPKRW